MGAWLQRPLSAYLADTVFVHGGLAEACHLGAISAQSRGDLGAISV